MELYIDIAKSEYHTFFHKKKIMRVRSGVIHMSIFGRFKIGIQSSMQ